MVSLEVLWESRPIPPGFEECCSGRDGDGGNLVLWGDDALPQSGFPTPCRKIFQEVIGRQRPAPQGIRRRTKDEESRQVDARVDARGCRAHGYVWLCRRRRRTSGADWWWLRWWRRRLRWRWWLWSRRWWRWVLRGCNVARSERPSQPDDWSESPRFQLSVPRMPGM